MIQSTASRVDKVAEKTITYAISQGRKKPERMALVIRKAVKELCKTLSCLLGNLGRQKYNSALNK